MATKTLEVDTNDIWAFRKWSKGAHKYPTPPISRGPNRTKAIYTEDKANTIHQELFQPPPNLPNTTTPNLNHKNPNDLPWHPITREEVRKAIFLPRKSKAPGLSQMNYGILRWAWLTNQSLFHSLIDRCARIRYHPKIWHITIAIAPPKPGEADHPEPRAYCLIQLLEYIGKVIEKLWQTDSRTSLTNIPSPCSPNLECAKAAQQWTQHSHSPMTFKLPATKV
jgi:hypothetical protein